MHAPGRVLDEATRLDWLRLIRSQNVGPRTFRALVNHYGGAGRALAALPALAERGGRRGIGVASLADAKRELALAERHGVRFVGLGEPDYPARLREEEDAPPLLAVRGDARALARPMIAIVGARNASAAGLKMAGILARGLGAAEFVVVSGLARGIDAAAHAAALAAGTVAVLAGGYDRPYPPENVDLLDRLVETGAAVSEMPMGHEPRARDFPRRNRLIAGMSLGVVVVEAAERSGSLITARIAGEQGREVFAVPGSPLDPRAAGTNRLLKEGATFVTDVRDILDAIRPILGQMASRPAPQPLEEPAPAVPTDDAPPEDARARIVSLLGPTPVSLDDLVRASGQPARIVRVVLLELELAGRIERQPGDMVALA